MAARAALTRMAVRLWWLPLAPLGFLADRGSRWRWLTMPGVVIATALASSSAKLLVRRPRPGSVQRVAPLGRLSAAGFPSTHSACAFAIAGWLGASRWARWLHAVAVLVAYSRVRRRAHHPGDVAAGAILGYAIARRLDRIARTPLLEVTAQEADPAWPKVSFSRPRIQVPDQEARTAAASRSEEPGAVSR